MKILGRRSPLDSRQGWHRATSLVEASGCGLPSLAFASLHPTEPANGQSWDEESECANFTFAGRPASRGAIPIRVQDWPTPSFTPLPQIACEPGLKLPPKHALNSLRLNSRLDRDRAIKTNQLIQPVRVAELLVWQQRLNPRDDNVSSTNSPGKEGCVAMYTYGT